MWSNNDARPTKAMSLLDESLSISRELGMRPLMERVLSRREILGAEVATNEGRGLAGDVPAY
jgi:hypothetical protein|tara:strand:+ start:238 stop:423 length:186 start_codon:yes stop_codon:yes gene_type:complete